MDFLYTIELLEAEIDSLKDAYKSESNKEMATEYSSRIVEYKKVIRLLKHTKPLQLLQHEVSGSFNKCTCLYPRPSCLTGHCTTCNRPIVKNITTDDLKNCH
ncbi:hypothetical protein [Flavobacterium mekongense]|uniref:hypothetical protein n=1 Tax=Flavobacterium mekongense TaxID=3379707 RepID=UPI00399AFCF8